MIEKLVNHANNDHDEAILFHKCCVDVIIAELREQIALEIEAHDDTSPFPCGCQNTYANIARGK